MNPLLEIIKNWLKENKQVLKFGCYLLVVFVVGFGSGKASNQHKPTPRSQSTYTQYTTPNTQNKAVDTAEADPAPTTAGPPVRPPAPAAAPTILDPATCTKIKGNISGSGKIYHKPGGASYKQVKAEICFNSEAEAEAAGFRKAAR